LTEAELQILPDLTDPDFLYSDIAEKHGIAEGTVKAHVSHIARKLRARGGRQSVVDKASQLRLLADN